MAITLGTDGITTNAQALTIEGTGAFRLPDGNNAQRPASPEVGMMRFDSAAGYLEVYNSSGWKSITLYSY